MGIKTSANKYYALRNVKCTEDFVIGENLAGEKVIVEKELVYPVCKGKHIRAWTFDYTHFIIPHRPTDWKPIAENVMKMKYHEAYEYFEKRRDKLVRRTDYSKSKGRPFYMVFRISKKKAASWRVAYAYTGTKLEACVIPDIIQSPILGVKKELVVEETAYFVAAKNQMEAFYIGGLLNSLPLRAYVQSFSKPKGFPYFGFYKWNIGILPIPKYDKSNLFHKKIAEASKRAHLNSCAVPELERIACELYQITKQELQYIKDTFNMLTGKLQESIQHNWNIGAVPPECVCDRPVV